MIRNSLLLLLTTLSLAIATPLSARTWTEAATGRTVEGNYVSADADHVVIKAKGRTFKIAIERLSDADKAFIREQSAKPGGEATDSFTRITPPATAVGSKVTGSGSKRKGTITIKNAAERGIVRLELAQLFLGADGAVVDNRSSELTFRLPPLRPGKSTTYDADGPFWAGGDDSDSIVEVVGVIQIIEFEDGSSWPPVPAQAPDADGDAPVGLAMIGVVGDPPLALPVFHCHNHGDKAVERVGYFIEFLDGEGKRLGSTNISAIVSGEEGGLKSKTGAILAPSCDTVPEGTKRAKLRCTNVIFADESFWQPSKSR
jgi:hypothetical protein